MMKKENRLSALVVMILLTCSLLTVGVAGDSSNADITVTMINQDPDPVEPGDNIELRFSVENYGTGTAENVLVEIVSDYPFSLEPGVSAQKQLGSISARQIGDDKVTLFYKMRVDKDAIEGTSEIDMRYSTNNGASWSKVGPFDVRIRATDSILTVGDVVTRPEKVAPGETVEVSITLKNDANTRLKDIKATLSLYKETTTGTTTTLEELPFTPVGSGIEMSVDKLDAGKEELVVFNLIVDADADTKPYKIPLTITYTDQYGEDFTKENTLGIVVYKKPDYTLNLESNDIFTSNRKGNVIISISNIGAGDMNYLNLKLKETEDYSVISTQKVYLGNLESDDYETAEFEIFVNSDKEYVPLQVELDYKDSYNEAYTETIMVPGIELLSTQQAMKYGLMPKPNVTGIILMLMFIGPLIAFWLYMLIDLLRLPMARYKKVLWVIVVVTANVLGAIIYYFIGRKNKKQA